MEEPGRLVVSCCACNMHMHMHMHMHGHVHAHAHVHAHVHGQVHVHAHVHVHASHAAKIGSCPAPAMGLMGLCNGAACGKGRRAAERAQCESMPIAARGARHSATRIEAPEQPRASDAAWTLVTCAARERRRLSRAVCDDCASCAHAVSAVLPSERRVWAGHVHMHPGVAKVGPRRRIRRARSRVARDNHGGCSAPARHAIIIRFMRLASLSVVRGDLWYLSFLSALHA